jgi:hypothetical protein
VTVEIMHFGLGLVDVVELEAVKFELVELWVDVTNNPEICTVIGAVCIRGPLLPLTMRV